MLFSSGDKVFESEKERNFYYKFFAGFYFNGMVPGVEERLQNFKILLENAGWEPKGGLEFCPESTHVSFDNHAYLFGYEKDRGEFADILLHDRKNKVLVCVEVKYLNDWSVKKDFDDNSERVAWISKKMGPGTDILQCLLVTTNKWRNGEKKINQKGSQIYKLQESYPYIENKIDAQRKAWKISSPKSNSEDFSWPLVILFWEDFLSAITNSAENVDAHKVKLKEFFEKQLNRKASKGTPEYEVVPDGFKKCSRLNSHT